MWQAARYHLSFESDAAIIGYPAGCYNAQMSTAFGRLQWNLIFVCWHTWNAYENGRGTKRNARGERASGKNAKPTLDETGHKLRSELSVWFFELTRGMKSDG